ncbi:MAG TPA: hypothetical protein PLA94_28310, partial [Myxococcota bacterium]|nr:hypothetical protein [Myxococcota bacterium]
MAAMFVFYLVGMSAALADSGDSGDCGYYGNPVDAAFVDGQCVTDELGDYCQEWWYGQCPTWDQVLEEGDGSFYLCPPGGELVYQAMYSNGEGGGLGLYFGANGELLGAWLWVTSYYFCCDGHRSFDYVRGNVDCLYGTPIEDPGHSSTDSSPDSTADSRAGSDADSRSGPPGDKDPSCGCPGRNSATAAVFGLLLLARRWWKR